MAVDKDKLQEAAPIARFHKIVLGWDYYGLLTELTVNSLSLFVIYIYYWFFILNWCFWIFFWEREEEWEEEEE